MGAESSRGEHGNRSPTGPPSASCQNSLVTTLPHPSVTEAVRATQRSNIPLFYIDTHIYTPCCYPWHPQMTPNGTLLMLFVPGAN